jgi:hypothetical protein
VLLVDVFWQRPQRTAVLLLEPVDEGSWRGLELPLAGVEAEADRLQTALSDPYPQVPTWCERVPDPDWACELVDATHRKRRRPRPQRVDRDPLEGHVPDVGAESTQLKSQAHRRILARGPPECNDEKGPVNRFQLVPNSAFAIEADALPLRHDHHEQREDAHVVGQCSQRDVRRLCDR